MKPLQAVLFGSVIGVYGAASYYIGLRGWQSLGRVIPLQYRVVYWLLFCFIAGAFLIGRFVGRFLPEQLERGITIIGSYWIAAMVYLLLITAAADLLRLLLRHSIRAVSGNPVPSAMGFAVLLFVAALLVYGTLNARKPVIRHYELTVDKSCGQLEKLRIAMASDMHFGRIVKKDRLVEMVDMLNGIKPDIVLLPGDIIDEDVDYFIKKEMGPVFRKLTARFGIYAVLGNHEYYGGAAAKAEACLGENGVQVLRDRAVVIDNSFCVAGRDDKTVESAEGRKRKTIEEIIGGIDPSMPLILMDHQPSGLDESKEQKVDLQLSGHTHRGQFFPLDFFTRHIFENDWGYLKKDTLNIIVTSGFGTWGPPVRIGNRPEIVDILVSFKS